MFEIDTIADTLPTRDLREGERLIEEGTRTGRIYIVDRGAFDVSKDGLTLCAVDERGVPFGEISALLGGPHQATVTAQTSARVLVIADHERMTREHPEFMLYIARHLAQRLADTDGYVKELQQQFNAVYRQLEPGEQTSRLKQIWDRFGELMRTEIADF